MAKNKNKEEYIGEEEDGGKEATLKSDSEASKNVLGSLLRIHKDDHFAFTKTENKVISSSSLMMDSLCKITTGQTLRLCAKGSELGKSSQALVFAENFMKTMPKSKTIFIKCEARLSEQIQKRSGQKFVEDFTKWDYGTIFIFPCNIFETIAKTLETLLDEMHKHGEYLCIIWDSLDGAILKQDISKSLWEGESPKVAGVPLLFKLLMRRFALKLEYYSGFLIIISQYTSEIKLDPYSKEPPRQNVGSGGSALNHQASYSWTYGPRYASDYILEDPKAKPDAVTNKTLGVYATIEITKSGTDVTGTKVKIPIRRNAIGCAIWASKECVDFALAYSVLERKGAWYAFSKDIIEEAAKENVIIQETHQGINSVYTYLEENKIVFDWLYNKFRIIIS